MAAPRRSLDRLISIAEKFSRIPPDQVRPGGYGRVSSDPTQGGTSVSGQKETHILTAGRNSWNLPEDRIWIDNDASASRFGAEKGVERPEWEKFRQAVRDRQLDVVLLTQTDRGSRTASFGVFVDECRASGTMLSVAGTLYDPGNVDHRMVLGISNTVAQGATERTHQESQRGKIIAANAGKPSGRPEWGFLRVYNSSGHLVEVVPHPDQAPVGEDIITQVAAGEKYADICKRMKAAGHLTPGGTKIWRTQTINQIVRSPRWIGMRIIGVTTDDKVAYSRPIDEYEMVDAIWPQVVDKDVWLKANRRIQKNKRGGGQSRRGSVSGFLSGGGACHVCKAPLRGTQGDRYQCDGWPPGDPRGGGHVSILREVADQMVGAAVVTKLADPRLRAFYEEDEEERGEREAALQELSEVQARLSALPGQVARDEVSLDLAPVMERKYRDRVAELGELARPRGLSPLVDELMVPDRGEVEAAWEGLSAFQQREVLAEITEWVELMPVGRGRAHSLEWPERSFHIRFLA